MKYIKNQFAKVVFLFLVISLIVTGMLKLADHDFIYSLSILFGCSSPAPLTLKICFFMFVILAQYFNADGFIFYIKNIDYLLIRYGSKYQTLRSLLMWTNTRNRPPTTTCRRNIWTMKPLRLSWARRKSTWAIPMCGAAALRPLPLTAPASCPG